MFDYRNLNPDAIALQAILASIRAGHPIRYGETGHPVNQPTDVFRIELPNGNGPFNTDLPNNRSHYDHLTQPNPGWPGYILTVNRDAFHEQMGITEAEFGRVHGDACYGCDSLAAVNSWFPPPARDYLSSYGAKIIRYQLAPGDYILPMDIAGEVIFNRQAAARLDELPVTIPIASFVPGYEHPGVILPTSTIALPIHEEARS